MNKRITIYHVNTSTVYTVGSGGVISIAVRGSVAYFCVITIKFSAEPERTYYMLPCYIDYV